MRPQIWMKFVTPHRFQVQDVVAKVNEDGTATVAVSPRDEARGSALVGHIIVESSDGSPPKSWDIKVGRNGQLATKANQAPVDAAEPAEVAE